MGVVTSQGRDGKRGENQNESAVVLVDDDEGGHEPDERGGNTEQEGVAMIWRVRDDSGNEKREHGQG